MLTINNINANGEIFRKLLNSVADKYECGVHFKKLDDEMEFEGDPSCALEIFKETVAMYASDD
jgi:hypothetical protein